jgi:hypothetical protein
MIEIEMVVAYWELMDRIDPVLFTERTPWFFILMHISS